MSSGSAYDLPPGFVPPPPRESLVFDDGEPMESQWHRDQMLTLIELLRRWLGRQGEDFYVGGNQALYFSALQARDRDFRAPDVFVVRECDPHMRDGWVVWDEGGRVPDLVIELTSPSTEREDRGPKKRVYERVLGVSEYFLCDPRVERLEGWRHDGERYLPIAAGSDGRLASRILQAAFGAWRGPLGGYEDTWLRLFGPDGELVPTAREAAEAATERAEAEAERAEAEAERAEAAAERAASLEARLAAYEARFGALED